VRNGKPFNTSVVLRREAHRQCRIRSTDKRFSIFALGILNAMADYGLKTVLPEKDIPFHL